MFEDIARLSSRTTRSISAENPTGGKGQGGRAESGTGAQAARELGLGWKVSPCIDIAPGEIVDFAEIEGPGIIRNIWITTHPQHWRMLILRAFWEDSAEPAIEVPLGDFFCNGWGVFSQVNSLVINANPNGGFNSYWPMPFRRAARLTIENTGDLPAPFFYQVNYDLGLGEDDSLAYLHAQFRRSNPLEAGELHPLLLGVAGHGHYAGCYLAWGSNSPGWWGEGEMKFYLDGDTDFPTIVGTGTEDYFGGAWNFEVPVHGYQTFTGPYTGLNQVLKPDGLYLSQQRFGMYRFHPIDPVRFESDISVRIQALGWRPNRTYRQLRDDIASTTFFYLDTPSTPSRPPLANREAREVTGFPVGLRAP